MLVRIRRSSGARGVPAGVGAPSPHRQRPAWVASAPPPQHGGCAAPQPLLLGPRPLPTAAAPNKGPAGREGGAASPATVSGLLEAPSGLGTPPPPPQGGGKGVGAGPGLPDLNPQAAHSAPRGSFWVAGMGVGAVLILHPHPPSPGLGAAGCLERGACVHLWPKVHHSSLSPAPSSALTPLCGCEPEEEGDAHSGLRMTPQRGVLS